MSPLDPAFADRAELLFTNLSGLRLSRLAVRLTGARGALTPARRALLGPQAEVREVSVSWQLPAEPDPAEHTVWLTLVPTASGVHLAGTSDGPDPSTQALPLWWLRPVTRDDRDDVTVLLGQGQQSSWWTDLAVDSAAAAAENLPASSRRRWSGHLVLEVPGTGADFAAVLGAAPQTYAGTAAVTRAAGPSTEAALRVVVNPALLDRPRAERRATLTHETVHVATRSAGSPAPLWAVEGLAEYVALRAWPETRDRSDRALAAVLASRGIPEALPADASFAAGSPDGFAAYAEAAFACRVIAEEHSVGALGRFYARLDAGASVAEAAEDTLGVHERDLVASWRAGLDRLASGGGAR